MSAKPTKAAKSSKKSSKGNKQKQNDTQMEMFKDIMVKTLQELTTDIEGITDLSNDVKQSLRSLVDGPSDVVMQELQNPESKLVKEYIPKDCLQKDPAGIKYLQLLSMLQPALKPELPPVVSMPLTAPKKPKHKKKKNVAASGTPNIADFLGGADNDLARLAQSAMADLRLDQKLSENSGIGDMISVMSEVSDYIKTKMEQGELDAAKLQDQATGMCEKMKSSPEFKKAMEANPSLRSMMESGLSSMNGDNVENNDSIPSGPNMMAPVQLMSQISEMFLD